MFEKKRLVASVLSLTAGMMEGCSARPQNSATCTQSLTNVDVSKEKQDAIGGFIESERFASEVDALAEASPTETPLKTRCTVLLVPVDAEKKEFDAYSARHCISPHLQKGYTLFLSYGGVFFEFPVLSEDVERIEQAKTEIRKLENMDNQRRMLRAFGGKMVNATALAINKYAGPSRDWHPCASKELDSGEREICAVFYDLRKTRIRLGDSVDPGGEKALSILNERYAKRLTKVNAKKTAIAKAVSDKLESLLSRLFDLSFVDVFDELKRCTQSSTSSFCKEKTAMEGIFKAHASSQFSDLFEETSSTDKAAQAYVSAFQAFLDELKPQTDELKEVLAIQSVFTNEETSLEGGRYLSRAFTRFFPKSSLVSNPQVQGAGLVFRTRATAGTQQAFPTRAPEHSA